MFENPSMMNDLLRQSRRQQIASYMAPANDSALTNQAADSLSSQADNASPTTPAGVAAQIATAMMSGGLYNLGNQQAAQGQLTGPNMAVQRPGMLA